MLLTLRVASIMGINVTDQIIDYFKGLIVADNWPELIRKPDEIISELDPVVGATTFESILQKHDVFLYVGRTEDLPISFARFYKYQPFKDWIMLLKLKDDPKADLKYIFKPNPVHLTVVH